MARKTKTVIIKQEGRDKNKHFLITEMSAAKAEKWAVRFLLALANAGIEVPEEIRGAGMSAVVIVGLKALGRVHFTDAEPLLDEMMGCVQYIPDPSKPIIVRSLIADDDIEEVSTLLTLRSEVFEIHTNFSIAGAISATQSEPASDTDEPPENSQAISTFRRRLGL